MHKKKKFLKLLNIFEEIIGFQNPAQEWRVPEAEKYWELCLRILIAFTLLDLK